MHDRSIVKQLKSIYKGLDVSGWRVKNTSNDTASKQRSAAEYNLVKAAAHDQNKVAKAKQPSIRFQDEDDAENTEVIALRTMRVLWQVI